MKLIQKIRKMIQVHEESVYADCMEDVAVFIESQHEIDNIEYVTSTTKDLGDRWKLQKNVIYKIEENEEVAYFQVGKMVGRTEYQSDGGVTVEEVVPKVEIAYVPKK